MTNRYIYDTSGIADRLSGYQGWVPVEVAVERREREMREEAERLARITYGR